MRSKLVVLIIAAISLSISIGCNLSQHDKKFNKTEWDSIGDFEEYPYRNDMLQDLIKNHKITGLTYHQLIDSLGQPQNYGDLKDSIRYDIIVNFGYLDPKSGKYLAIGFNKDSISTGFKIVDWKNRHVNE